MPTSRNPPPPPPPEDTFGAPRRGGYEPWHGWPSVSVDVAATRQVQLEALADLLDEAVAAQPDADRAIAACGEPGPLPAAALFEAGQQDSVFHGLIVRLHSLRVGPEPTGLQERAARLLNCHFWLLHEAVNVACGLRHGARAEAARLRLNGLGAPAAELRALRDEARAAAERANSAGASL